MEVFTAKVGGRNIKNEKAQKLNVHLSTWWWTRNEHCVVSIYLHDDEPGMNIVLCPFIYMMMNQGWTLCCVHLSTWWWTRNEHCAVSIYLHNDEPGINIVLCPFIYIMMNQEWTLCCVHLNKIEESMCHSIWN